MIGTPGLRQSSEYRQHTWPYVIFGGETKLLLAQNPHTQYYCLQDSFIFALNFRLTAYLLSR
jgi:hypothetical protein